jgi:hypothetical protein
MGRGEARSGSSREGGARARAVARRRANRCVKYRSGEEGSGRQLAGGSRQQPFEPARRVDGSQILDRKGCPGQRVPRVADWVPKSSVKIDRR